MTLDPLTERRLRSLDLPAGPLFVVDVDDVVLTFVGPLRELIADEGLHLVTDTYRLHGNVRDRSGEAVANERVSALIDRVFAEQERRQRPVDGAQEGLDRLSRHGAVVLLTAMRHGHFEARERHLRAQGIDHPLVTTEGSKGRAIASVASEGPVVFVDDLPSNHADVLTHVPHATAIHFMAEPVFAHVMPPLPEPVLVAESWEAIVETALGAIAGNSEGR